MVEEALYGGAAGGGKTEALLMAALQYIDVPGYSAGIFRRSKPEMLMPDAPLDRARAWFGPALHAGRVRWDADANTFFFLTRTGELESSLHFGYLANTKDEGRYQSSAFQFIGVDELTFWEESRYRFLFSRARYSSQLAVRDRMPIRMRAGTNPGGPGHRWVKKRFVSSAVHVQRGSEALRDIESRRKSGAPLPAPALYVSPPSPEALELAAELGRKPRQAYFVPAFAADNPALVGDSLARYREQLLMLDPVRRLQLEWGDWEAESTGGFFSLASFEFVDAAPVVPRWLRSWDMAATEETPGRDPDWTVGGLCGLHTQKRGDVALRRFVVRGLERFREEPPRTEERVVRVADRDGHEVEHLFEVEGGSAGKSMQRQWSRILMGKRVSGIRKTGAKAGYWRPLSGYAANVAPIILVRGDYTEALVEELTRLPIGHDDIADSLSQGFHWLSRGDSGTDFSRLDAGPTRETAPLATRRL